MSDLDGEDAFKLLLDRMTDAIVSERFERDAAVEARSALSIARRENEELARRASTAEKELSKLGTGMPKLNELLQAAMAAIPHLVQVQGTRERLTKAVEEAGPWCDDVPF